MANPTKITVVPKVIRKWELEDGTAVRPVSNVEDYEESQLIKVGDKDAKKTYVRLEDYTPTVRVSATEENLVAVAKEQGISEDMARMLFRQAKALGKK